MLCRKFELIPIKTRFKKNFLIAQKAVYTSHEAHAV